MQQPVRHTITIPQTGESFVCREDQMIWDAMWRVRSAAYRHSCFGGGCGACKMRVLSGNVFVAKRMSSAHVSADNRKDNGVYLMCCIQPRGDVVLTSK